MYSFKNFLLRAIFVTFILFCFVSSSSAISIEELRPLGSSTVEYYRGYYHTAYVETDVPFYEVNWYVDGKYVGRSDGSNVETDAYFNYFDLTGSFEGEIYEIKAIAWSLDDDGNTDSDTDTYYLTVYNPEEKVCNGTHTRTYTQVEITGFHYDTDATVTWDDFFNQEVDWKGTANCSGTYYLENNSSDETYSYEWEARLDILEHPGRDEKEPKPGMGGLIDILPGKTFSHTQSLSLPVDRTGAPRDGYYTMSATYTLRVRTGRQNEVDQCSQTSTSKF